MAITPIEIAVLAVVVRPVRRNLPRDLRLSQSRYSVIFALVWITSH
ncbi:MAG: hypothetical protein HYW93_06390 [Thaumarchaeota archaeon]|nr:hypothetical protein [Nitrososphaerota archaeon]